MLDSSKGFKSATFDCLIGGRQVASSNNGSKVQENLTSTLSFNHQPSNLKSNKMAEFSLFILSIPPTDHPFFRNNSI